MSTQDDDDLFALTDDDFSDLDADDDPITEVDGGISSFMSKIMSSHGYMAINIVMPMMAAQRNAPGSDPFTITVTEYLDGLSDESFSLRVNHRRRQMEFYWAQAFVDSIKVMLDSYVPDDDPTDIWAKSILEFLCDYGAYSAERAEGEYLAACEESGQVPQCENIKSGFINTSLKSEYEESSFAFFKLTDAEELQSTPK